MSIQRCEYELTTTRGGIEGEICTLTGRGCMITDLLKVDNCQRRLWAKQYQGKHLEDKEDAAEDAGEALSRLIFAQGGMG